MPGPLTAHVRPRNAPQLDVHDGHQLVERAVLAGAQTEQQLCHLWWHVRLQ